VTVLSQQIRVTGVTNSAKVAILDGSTEVGGTTANADGEIHVPLNTLALVENHFLSGTQTTTDGTSPVTKYTIRVQGVSLGAPTLKSVLHTCMTDVRVDGLCPGATLVTRVNGVVFGKTLIQPSRLPTWCGMDRQRGIDPESKIEIIQQATIGGTLNEGPSPALPPVPKFLPPEGPLPAGSLAIVKQCDAELHFSNMTPGARTEINNEGQVEAWLNPAEIFTGVNGPPMKAGTMELVQKFPRCRRDGIPWTETVDPLTSLTAPTVKHEICREVLRLTVSGLVPNGFLDLFLVTTPPGGVTTETFLGRRPFNTETDVVDLPPDIPFDSPGELGIAIKQLHCGLESPRVLVDRKGGGILTDGGPPRFTAELFECSCGIPLGNVFAGAIVQALDSNGNSISDQIQVKELTFVLKVWPPLRRGTVTIVSIGCGADFKISTTVNALPSPLPTPAIPPPLHPGGRTVRLDGVLSGATVYVLVNGAISSSPIQMFEKERNAVWLWRPLVELDRVSAVQMLCERASKPGEGEFTVVTIGILRLSGNPATAVRGTTVTFTITAVDSENGEQIAANVYLKGNSIGSTGQAIHYSPALGDPNPTFVVSAPPAFKDATFSISLSDPIRNWSLTVRAQPIPTSIPDLDIGVNIDSLTFEVVPTWDTASKRVLKASIPQPNPGFPTIATATATLPIPTGGNKVVNVTISGTATAYLAGAAQVLITSDRPTIGYGYSGNNNGLISWNLSGVSIIDPVTGEGIYSVNAEWAGSS